jgi:hypothetical protein
MVEKMRTVLDNVLFQDLSEKIQKLSVPASAHVRVIIETINETNAQTQHCETSSVDNLFLKQLQTLPIAHDLPEDLAHQHDHYLYGLSKKV